MNIVGDNSDNTLNGISDNDVIDGLGGNDQMDGLWGNDTLRGGSGDNVFVGGAGDDTYILTGRFEYVECGSGNDLVDLSEFKMGYGFVTVDMVPTAGAIVAVIDGEEDFGMIRSSLGETTTFKDLNNAMRGDTAFPEGGMEILGTLNNDLFMIDAGANGWISIAPGLGDDDIKIEANTGRVGLDYSDYTSIFGTGIRANLKFGYVFEDAGFYGFGRNFDQITGSGFVAEFQATRYDDTIHGDKNDNSFILLTGDDFVSGGGGVDQIRYDRSGVKSVVVDLEKGTATGTWYGETFSHTLRNIENILGSLDGNDQLVGSGAANLIYGNGGNDVITGKGGNDTMVGGAGADRFVFRSNDGDDVIEDFQTAGNLEKISLRAVSAITGFADLKANHMTQVNDGSTRATIIDDGAGLSITLNGLLIADLDRGDFIF